MALPEYLRNLSQLAGVEVIETSDAGRCLTLSSSAAIPGQRLFAEFPLLAAGVDTCIGCGKAHGDEPCVSFGTWFGGLQLERALNEVEEMSVRTRVDASALLLTIQLVALRCREDQRDAVVRRKEGQARIVMLDGAEWLRNSFASTAKSDSGEDVLAPLASHASAAKLLAALIPPPVLKAAHRASCKSRGISLNKSTASVDAQVAWLAHHIGKVCSNMHETAGVGLVAGSSASMGGGAMFPMAATMEHSCRANCNFHVQPTGEMVVSALEDIEPGTRLSIDYGTVYLPTRDRRQYLLQHYRFLCRCTLCETDRDLARAFLCENCPGVLACAGSAPSEWTCDGSESHVASASHVEKMLEAEARASSEEAVVRNVETLLQGGLFHESHYLVFQAMRAQLIGGNLGSTDERAVRYVKAMRQSVERVLSTNDPFQAQFFIYESQMLEGAGKAEEASHAKTRALELQRIAGALEADITTIPRTSSVPNAENNATGAQEKDDRQGFVAPKAASKQRRRRPGKKRR